MKAKLHCGLCGSVDIRFLEKETAYLCSECGDVQYLNSKPSVCAILTNGPNVLLVSDHPQEDSWDLPGGFLLFGESPNEGLRRELVEELNVDVSVGRLIDAQVDAYGADEEYSLNLFYEAEIISGTPKPSGEIKRIAWFQLSYLPTLRYKSTRAVLNALQPLHTD